MSKVNPWAICHSQLGKEKTKKFERCVMKIKVKHDLKEGIKRRLRVASSMERKMKRDVASGARTQPKSAKDLTKDELGAAKAVTRAKESGEKRARAGGRMAGGTKHAIVTSYRKSKKKESADIARANDARSDEQTWKDKPTLGKPKSWEPKKHPKTGAVIPGQLNPHSKEAARSRGPTGVVADWTEQVDYVRSICERHPHAHKTHSKAELKTAYEDNPDMKPTSREKDFMNRPDRTLGSEIKGRAKVAARKIKRGAKKLWGKAKKAVGMGEQLEYLHYMMIEDTVEDDIRQAKWRKEGKDEEGKKMGSKGKISYPKGSSKAQSTRGDA